MTADELRAATQNFSLVSEVDQLAKGHIRLETQLKYPDGTSIEVFLTNGSSAQSGFRLSDLGQTTAWLMTAQVKPWLSKKKRDLITEVLRLSNARQEGGAFSLTVATIEELPTAILKLAQVCLRVADLTYTKRTALQNLAREEVEEVLADLELQYDPEVEIPTRNRRVKVDFVVHATRTESAVLTLSSMNPNSAHTMATDIFTKWYDIDSANCPHQRVTVYDDRKNVYRDDDLRRIEDISILVPLSDRTGMSTILTQ